jgi:hypothetical protein
MARGKKVSCFTMGEKVTKLPLLTWKKGLNCSKGGNLTRKYKGIQIKHYLYHWKFLEA